MTKGFRDGFQHYLPPSSRTMQNALREGLVVLDTNVLLNAYRFAPDPREELLSAIERLQDRLWIPHQVALEFHQNRLNVVAKLDAAYTPVLDAIDTAQDHLNSELPDKVRELANRVALSEEEKSAILQSITQSLDPARAAVNELRNKHGFESLSSDDSILRRLDRIFAGKVGDPMEEVMREAALKEADRRIKERVPPGYKDNKPGDYFVWRQTLDEASARESKYLTIVTGDVKEDWYKTVSGRTISARPELTEEAFGHAGTRLVIMNTHSFLYHAKLHLNAIVSANTLQQAAKAGDMRKHLRPANERLSDVATNKILERIHLVEKMTADYKRETAEILAMLREEDNASTATEGINELRRRLRSLQKRVDILNYEHSLYTAELELRKAGGRGFDDFLVEDA